MQRPAPVPCRCARRSSCLHRNEAGCTSPVHPERVEQELYGFRRGRIRYVFVKRQIWTSPRRALVCECKRFVEMKVVNHVRVGIRLEKKHLVESRPAMTTGDYRVIRRACTDRGDQFSLYAVPAITVLDHRLVYHFEKHESGSRFADESQKHARILRMLRYCRSSRFILSLNSSLG